MIGVVILTALLLDLALNAVADYLNLKALNLDLPEEFKDVYDKERYHRSQEYLKVNTRFGWVTASFNIFMLLIFTATRAFKSTAARSLTGATKSPIRNVTTANATPSATAGPAPGPAPGRRCAGS